MLELYQFGPVDGKNASPFCAKVEIYCQLAHITYKTVPTLPMKAPRGKLPFIVDQGKTIADSSLIIAYLRQTYKDLDADLTEEQRAQGHLLYRLCEQSLYFAMIYSRWVDEDFWPVTKAAFFKDLPAIPRAIVPALSQRGIKKTLHFQGYGRYTKEEIYALGIADIKAIATILAHSPFAAAELPTSYDASVYAFLNAIIKDKVDTPLKLAVIAQPALVKYVSEMDRIVESYQKN